MLQIGNDMSRIALTCCFAALLGSCNTLSANKIDFEQARLACADVGIEPGTSAFDQCAFNLYNTLWEQRNTAGR
jgi:hypothetical protein